MELSRKELLEVGDIDAASAASTRSFLSNPVRVAVAGKASHTFDTAGLVRVLRTAGLHPVCCERQVNLETLDPGSGFDALVHCASASVLGWRADLVESTRYAPEAPLLAVIEQPKPGDLLCALEIGAHAALPREVGADVLAMQARRLATLASVRGRTIALDDAGFNDSERRLLHVLNANRGRLVPYGVLVEASGLGPDAYDTLGLLRVKMSRLRKKLGVGRVLKNCRNAGYVLHCPRKDWS